jgi:hypothetical protein
MSAIRVSTSASHACGSTSFSLAVMISVAMAAARSGAFGAGEQPRLATECKSAIFDKAGKPAPALEWGALEREIARRRDIVDLITRLHQRCPHCRRLVTGERRVLK